MEPPVDDAPSASPTQSTPLRSIEALRRPQSYATLPMDLLLIIMRSVPVHYRIRHASSVCKRWRTAALQTVTSIPHEVEPSAIALFPSLIEASIAIAPGTVVLPTSLTKLMITKVLFPEKDALSCTFSPCPPLTSISFPVKHTSIDALLPVLTAAAGSLTFLEIRDIDIACQLANELKRIWLPRLTSLSFPISAAGVYLLLPRHCSSLTHLSVPWRGALRVIRDNYHALTALTSLDIVLYSMDEQTAILTTLRNLSTLSVRLETLYPNDWCVPALNRITSLTIGADRFGDFRQASWMIRNCAPQLRSLHAPSWFVAEIITSAIGFAKYVHSIRFTATESRITGILNQCSNVQFLHFERFPPSITLDKKRRLMQLREVRIDDYSSLQWIDTLRDIAPKLERITVRLWQLTARKAIGHLKEMLIKMEKRRIPECHLLTTRGDSIEALAAVCKSFVAIRVVLTPNQSVGEFNS